MATPTTNKGYLVPTLNSDFNVWGSEVNGNYAIQDLNLGGAQSISVAGSSNVTATTSEAQYLLTVLTGILTGNIEYILPAVGGFYFIANATSGAYTLTIACAGAGSTVVLPQGVSMVLVCDGTNIISGTSAYALKSSVPSGAQLGDIKHSALNIESNGWRQCYGQARPQTDPFWVYMVANGLTASWLPGYTGTSTYNMPDARDMVLAGLDNMGGSARGLLTAGVAGFDPTVLLNAGGSQHAQQDTISVSVRGAITAASSASNTVTDTGHVHGAPSGYFVTTGGNPGGGGGNFLNNYLNTASATTGISVATVVTTTITNMQTITATSGLTGASQNVQPTMMTVILMYVGA